MSQTLSVKCKNKSIIDRKMHLVFTEGFYKPKKSYFTVRIPTTHRKPEYL